MPASRVDTYAEALERIYDFVAKAKIVPDANLPFLIGLETQIMEEIRSPERRMQEQGIIPSEQQNPQGMGALGGGGGGMGMSAPPPSFLGAGAGAGVQMSPGGPANADEMRRVLSGPA